MVSDQQVKRLWRLAGQQWPFEVGAAKAGMDLKTARKYLRDRRLPSELRQKHTWRTRQDSSTDVCEEIRERLVLGPGLQAKTLFEHFAILHQRDRSRRSFRNEQNIEILWAVVKNNIRQKAQDLATPSRCPLSSTVGES